MRFGRSKVKEDTPSVQERETRPHDPAEERLLSGILAQAEVDDVAQTEQMLWRAQVKGSDLVAGTEGQNEALLQQAGLPVADCLKIMRVLRTLHGEPAPPSRGGAGPSSRGVVLGVQSFKPSMKCGLIVYSATVLVVTLCVLSFYVPAVIYQLRNGRRGASALPPHGAGGRYGLTSAGGAGGAGAGSGFQPLLAGSTVMVVTANQPLPCTTRRGDWVMGLALRNKLMYATLHGYKMWWSTELVSSWDLEAAWNKIPLLYILMHPESSLTQGIEWMLWMDDDAVFTDMEFVFPFADYDAAGVNLVIWGDPQRVYRANDIQGLNTGVFLLRKCEWSRQLMAEVAALATPSIRRQIGNKGRIAEQGALTWVLHSQAAKWKDR